MNIQSCVEYLRGQGIEVTLRFPAAKAAKVAPAAKAAKVAPAAKAAKVAPALDFSALVL